MPAGVLVDQLQRLNPRKDFRRTRGMRVPHTNRNFHHPQAR